MFIEVVLGIVAVNFLEHCWKMLHENALLKTEILWPTIILNHSILISVFGSSLTVPIRTTTGLRASVVQCAAVNMKYSEIIVPPQSKLILYCSFR